MADLPATESNPAPTGPLEPLACVACRSRKIKCDRTKPACSRCTRSDNGVPCVYPESRRKPVFKHRNVKDLEARLDQVEDLLNRSSVGKSNASDASTRSPPKANVPAPILQFFHVAGEVSDPSYCGPFSVACDPYDEDREQMEAAPETAADFLAGSLATKAGSTSGRKRPRGPATELIDLGLSEPMPPYEVVDELHTAYFQNQQMYVPIIQPARYLKAYHSAPHLRPPIALQYAIWALASQVHPTYSAYHDVFYRRSRQYLEADEMRGHGEHFITVAHAQAWELIATYEARRMYFTRAAMSCSRCVRLVGMMGLHRLDAPPGTENCALTIPPPADWVEIEERRRVFWGAFCIDSHASISTGWPSLLGAADATTHLPSSEEAFDQGRAENSCTLDAVFEGNPYSTFASAVIICHLFNKIMQHVQENAMDQAEDVQHGRFWLRHRELDSKIIASFMFLPERYRLPGNLRNPIAVHANLNLHASVICLHNAARERANQHNLPDSVKRDSRNRLLTAAQEIVNIMRQTSHMASSFRTPLASLSLYCAASVFVHQAMMEQQQNGGNPASEDGSLVNSNNIEFIFQCMEAIERTNSITRLFLKQSILDVDRNGLASAAGFSWFAKYRHRTREIGNYIPVLCRSAVSKHSNIQPPLPGRLPRKANQPNNKPQTACCPIDSANPCGRCRGKLSWDARETGRTSEASKRQRLQSPEIITAATAKKPFVNTGSCPGTSETLSPTLPHRFAAPSGANIHAVSFSAVPESAASDPLIASGLAASFATGESVSPLQNEPQEQQADLGVLSNMSVLDRTWQETSASAGASVSETLSGFDMSGITASGSDQPSGDSSLALDSSFMYSQLAETMRRSGFDPPMIPVVSDVETNPQDPWSFLADFDNDKWDSI